MAGAWEAYKNSQTPAAKKAAAQQEKEEKKAKTAAQESAPKGAWATYKAGGAYESAAQRNALNYEMFTRREEQRKESRDALTAARIERQQKAQARTEQKTELPTVEETAQAEEVAAQEGFAEAAADAFVSGGAASWLGGMEAAHAQIEAGANKAAAWVLRDLANSKILNGVFGEQYRSSLNNLADSLQTDIDWSGAQAWQDEYDRIMEQALKDRSTVGAFVVQNLPSVGAMILDAGASLGLGKNPVTGAANVQTLPIMATRAEGNAATEAKSAGATDAEAVVIGLENAAVEVFSEKLFGGNPIYDADVGLVNRAAAKLGNKTLMKVLDSKAFDLASEGLEEVVAELLEPTFQSLVLDGTLKDSVSAEDLGMSFLGGVFVGALGNAASLPTGIYQARQESYRKQYGKIFVENTIGSENADVRSAAEAIQEKLDYGRAPDLEDFGRLLDALDRAGESDAAVKTAEDVAQTQEAPEEDSTQNRQEDDLPGNMVLDEDDAPFTMGEEQNAELPGNMVLDNESDLPFTMDGETAKSTEQQTAEQPKRTEERGLELPPNMELDETLTDDTVQGLQRQIGAQEEAAAQSIAAQLRQEETRAVAMIAEKAGYDDALKSQVLRGFEAYYDKTGGDAETYTDAVAEVYQQGQRGETMQKTGAMADIAPEVLKQAYNAGRNTNGSKSTDDGGKRNESLDSGKQSGSVEKSAERVTEQSGEKQGRSGESSLRTRGKAAGIQKVSARQLGIVNGSAEQTLFVLPEETARKQESLQTAEKTLRDAGAKRVQFVTGSLRVTGTNGKEISVEAVTQGKEVWIKADAKLGVEKTAEHEALHMMMEQDPEVRARALAGLLEMISEGELNAMAQRYAEAYHGCYGMGSDAYIDEILCDAYAGINRGNLGVQKYKDAVRPVVEQERQQTTKKADAARAPPERYSIDENYRQKLNTWAEDGMPSDVTFALGTTGDVLQGLGAVESDIYMNGAKICTILAEHPEMSLKEIERVPEILEDPVLILKSKGVNAREKNNSRLVLFGSLQAQDGKPVLTVMDLRPQENGFLIDDMQKVNTAFVKKNPAGLLRASEVLYADKKRTAALLRRFGLTIASRELLRSGYMGSISYNRKNVNIHGEKFSDVVKTAEEKNDGARFSADEKKYSYRYTNRKENVMSDWGHAMFADDPDASAHYGRMNQTRYRVDNDLLTGIGELKGQVAAKLNEQYENKDWRLPPDLEQAMDEGVSAEELAEEFDPQEIVMSAGGWDNGEFMQWFWDNIAEPQEIKGVKTNDGAIVFDESLIESEENDRAWLDAFYSAEENRVPAGKEQDTEENRAAAEYENLPKRAKEFADRAVNQTVRRMAGTMSVPGQQKKNLLKPAVQQMMTEYLKTGQVSQKTIDETFDAAYAAGVEEDREFYDTYKPVKKMLRETALKITPEMKADIADFEAFRKAAFGRLRLTNSEGMDVDAFYQELREQAPGLFPKDVVNPADQLRKMMEVSEKIRIAKRTLDEAYGDEAAEFKKWAKNDYDASVGTMIGTLRNVRRYAEAAERNAKAQEQRTPQTAKEAQALYTALKDLRRDYERVRAKMLLTEADQRVVLQLLRGDITPEQLKGHENEAGILKTFEAKADYDAALVQIALWRRKVKEQYREQVRPLLENIDGTKDKAGIALSRETMVRNVRDIFPAADANRIIREVFWPVRQSEANATKAKNQYRERVRALGLSRNVASGNLVSEAHAVQLWGEAEDNIRVLKDRPAEEMRDGRTLEEWKEVIRDLWESNPNLDREKIRNAAKAFHGIYDELFRQMNEVRVRNGYEPINYRQGYFPHFQPGQTDGILTMMSKAVGVNAEVTALPTTINGLTHTFKPGIRWFGNALERTGFNTAYDAVEGFDKYVEGAASVIYQTDNIQRLRAFASEIRYAASDDALRQRVDKIRENPNLTDRDRELRLREVYEQGRYRLGNFVNELEEYTNILAGKRSRFDRTMESALGRGMYNIMQQAHNRIGANMVALNPGSWLTNFMPILQAAAEMKTGTVLKAMKQTTQALNVDDGITERSAFLTNRVGSDPLIRGKMEEISTKLSIPMEVIDQFTAGTVVRARYMENLERGMSEEDAMLEADQYAADVMAARSKGEMPTLFESRNPLIKMFTQFQLEANNELSHIFKDLPRGQRDKAKKALAWVIFKYCFGMWMYDELFEKVVGRRPGLDPINWIMEAYGDVSGNHINNLLDAAMTGELVTKTEPGSVLDAAGGVLENVAGSIPGSQVLALLTDEIDTGRVPITQAIPNVNTIATAAANEKLTFWQKAQKIGEELANPVLYLAMPFGGGQVQKMAKGIFALTQGGSFKTNSDGDVVMQYPVYNEKIGDAVINTTKVLLFGKSSTYEARKWVDNDFKSLSKNETDAYLALTAADIPQRESWELIQTMKGISKKSEKLEALKNYDISDTAKTLYYYCAMTSENERAQLDAYAEEDPQLKEAMIQRKLNTPQEAEEEKDEAQEAAEKEAARKSLAAYAQMYLLIQSRQQESGGYKTVYERQLKALMDSGLRESEARKEIRAGLRNQLKEDFAAGGVTEENAKKFLKDHCGEDEDDAYWTLEEWKNDSDWEKYGQLKTALESGESLKDTMQYYKEHGVDKGTLSQQITSYFKPLYLEADSAGEKQKIKSQALDAYAAAGYSRSEKTKDINKWK